MCRTYTYSRHFLSQCADVTVVTIPFYSSVRQLWSNLQCNNLFSKIYHLYKTVAVTQLSHPPSELELPS